MSRSRPCLKRVPPESALAFPRGAPKLSPSMASLAQLLAQHGCILVLDAASTRIQVGLLRVGQPALWRASTDESGKALFALTDETLRAAGLALGDVRAFAFDAGPGSMLGVRTAAMALRTWQALAPRPTYAFHSLALLAHQLAAAGTPRPFAVISDARRETWHLVMADAQGVTPLPVRAPAADVAAFAGEVFLPTEFRAFSAAPRATRDSAFDVAAALAALPDADLFTSTEAPDAFQHEAPEYKKWTAEVHSAARATR